MSVYLSAGNSKLEKTGKAMGRRIVAFNLPPDHAFTTADGVRLNTCPGALACRAVCYAKQGRLAMPAAVRIRQENLQAALSPDFVFDVLAALRASKADTVRVHDSGDFFSQGYLDAWFEIASLRPDVTFYAYTKSLHLDFSKTPANFRITQSIGGKYDTSLDPDFPHSRIFSSHAAREAAGYIDGNVDDSPAINGLVQIGLVYHGTRKLTDAQSQYFA